MFCFCGILMLHYFEGENTEVAMTVDLEKYLELFKSYGLDVSNAEQYLEEIISQASPQQSESTSKIVSSVRQLERDPCI